MPQAITCGVRLSAGFPKEGGSLSSEAVSPLCFWEIEPFFRCPVVSHCLTLAEQRKLLKKSGLPWKKMSPFQIHTALVDSGESQNALSEGVNRALSRKYERQAVPLRQMPVGEFNRHWESCFESGRYLAELWVAATHRNLTPEKRKAIFGSIHMSMYATADRLSAVKRFTEHLKKEMLLQRERGAFFKKRCSELEQLNELLLRELETEKKQCLSVQEEKEDLRAKLELLEEESTFAGLRAENEDLKSMYLEQKDQLWAMNEAFSGLEGLSAALEAELKNERKANLQLRGELEKPREGLAARCHCDETCPVFNLCRKRVLIVGGITRMGSLYREIVEANGGIFDYHDGDMNGKGKHLECSLKRADFVLCPVSCNSHAACLLVKRLGKKYGKSIHMMSNFSMTAVTQKLAGLVLGVAGEGKNA